MLANIFLSLPGNQTISHKVILRLLCGTQGSELCFTPCNELLLRYLLLTEGKALCWGQGGQTATKLLFFRRQARDDRPLCVDLLLQFGLCQKS